MKSIYVGSMSLLLVSVLGLGVGCAQQTAHAPHNSSATDTWQQLQQDYQVSLADAAIIEDQEILPVTQIFEPTQRFVTWTSYPDSFSVGEEKVLSWGEVWVTLDNAVQQRCKHFPKDKLNLRIQQLLGLPPQQAAVDRFFVVLNVNTRDMFRPCANPSLQDAQCSASFPESASEAHKAWYAGQTALAYYEKGYPWTRLGYTYNWNAEDSEVGVSEFVIHRGAKVSVESITPTVEYCRAS